MKTTFSHYMYILIFQIISSLIISEDQNIIETRKWTHFGMTTPWQPPRTIVLWQCVLHNPL